MQKSGIQQLKYKRINKNIRYLQKILFMVKILDLNP